jgi:NAD(P)-dependent dehydrogenase (short-subunit alcohol dehydrogenase family)
MMLKNKVVVIYGAGGDIGGAAARAFAHEGAKVFLIGLYLASVEVVAKEINAARGSAEAVEVNALNEQAIEKHLQSVIDKTGRIDISFNAVGITDLKIVCATYRSECRTVFPADRGLYEVVFPDCTPSRKAHGSE